MKSTERTLQLAPSVLNAPLLSLGTALDEFKKSGVCLIHLDVMDGAFVPPISFGEELTKQIAARDEFFVEAHLMVTNPLQKLESFIEAGAKRIIFHLEACHHPHRALQLLKSKGVETGIAINPGTPLVSCKELLPLADVLLVMTVNPGWGGQAFLPESVRRVTEARDLIISSQSSTRIEVDGGISPEMINEIFHVGADIAVVGSFLYRGDSITSQIALLYDALEESTRDSS